MCTISLFRHQQKLIVTMSRDEARVRAEAGLKQRTSNHREVLYPIDGQAGGTWFGVNDTGVVMALLNRYQDPQVKVAPTRGQIIPNALAQGNYESICHYLANYDFSGFNPFDLFLMALTSSHHFSWNGHKIIVSQHTQETMQFSSSGLDTAVVIGKRQAYFKAQLTHHPLATWQAPQILEQLHLYQDPLEPSHSILMDRPHTHSKSICQVQLQAHQCQFDYYPEASLTRWRQQAMTVSQLPHQQRELTIKSTPLTH